MRKVGVAAAEQVDRHGQLAFRGRHHPCSCDLDHCLCWNRHRSVDLLVLVHQLSVDDAETATSSTNVITIINALPTLNMWIQLCGNASHRIWCMSTE